MITVQILFFFCWAHDEYFSEDSENNQSKIASLKIENWLKKKNNLSSNIPHNFVNGTTKDKRNRGNTGKYYLCSVRGFEFLATSALRAPADLGGGRDGRLNSLPLNHSGSRPPADPKGPFVLI